MRVVDLIPAQYQLLAIGALLAALAWKIQEWRYGRQLEQQARLQADTLNELAQASAARQRIEQDKRLVLEQRLSASEQAHYRALSDVQRVQGHLRDRLATADRACQSYSTPLMHPVAAQCQSPPQPTAWFIAPQEPNLTQRMLNELSASPMPAIKD